jgi:predicted dienelactone hydrolase
MRPLEIVIAFLLVISLVPFFFPRRPRGLGFLSAVGILVVILQLVFEGYRWQMLPLYVLTGLVFLLGLPALLRGRRPDSLRARLAAGAGLLATVVAVLLPVLFPIPHEPSPTGPYPVGTFSLMLTDDSRHELYSGNLQDPRRIMVQIWYPADPKPGTPLSPWVDHPKIFGPAIARILHLPAFFLDHLKYARTQSYLDAPVSSARASYPVLLFSHGWTGFRAQNTYQVQELASHGYIVAAVQHTYGAAVTVFPDGSIVPYDPQALPDGAPTDVYDAAANKLVDQWAGDLGFVLDTLTQMNASDGQHGLQGRLDLTRVGVFGHSTGGGAAVEFCARDPRCQAGLGEDAFLTPVSGSVLDTGLRQPFLFLYSEEWSHKEKNVGLFGRLYAHSDRATTATILGTKHYDFTDLPLLTPLAARLGLKGPIDGRRVMYIVDAYSLHFFDKYLLGRPTDLLDGPSAQFLEVKFP